MPRFLLLDRGEELGDGNYRALSAAASSVRLKLLEPAPPFGEGQILQIAPVTGGAARPPGLFLFRSGAAFHLGSLGVGRRSDDNEVVGRAVAAERGHLVFFLDRGVLARVPGRWLPGALDALEVLGRFRHPITPSLYVGSGERCLQGVREKYNRGVEVRQYASLALTGLHASEWEVVERHIKPGGRILDIGCAAGREALAFARAGYRVVGIDIAPGMVEAARLNAERESLGITFRVQSATEIDDPPHSFDGVYFGGSYPHIPGRALRVETLTRIRRALAPDGALVLEVIYRGPWRPLSRSRLVDLIRRVGKRIFPASNLSEPGDGYLREVSEASDPRELVFLHEFAGPGEVRAEVEAAGLRGEEVTPGCWVCRVAQA